MAKILIVDDETLIREVLKHILTQDGYEVIEAENGDAAIKKTREEKPDLIVLDMNMPKMTGFEVAPLVRSHPDTMDIPIIALTASADSQGVEEAHNAGCDRYLSKPIDKKILLEAVTALLTHS